MLSEIAQREESRAEGPDDVEPNDVDNEAPRTGAERPRTAKHGPGVKSAHRERRRPWRACHCVRRPPVCSPRFKANAVARPRGISSPRARPSSDRREEKYRSETKVTHPSPDRTARATRSAVRERSSARRTFRLIYTPTRTGANRLTRASPTIRSVD